MGMRRYALKVDANLTLLVQAYRDLGVSVHVLNGVVDLIVGYGGICELVELKSDKKITHRRTGQLTKAQIKFRETWTVGVRLVQSLDDVQIHVALMRKRHQAITAASLT